ncbi:tRNA (Uracil-5-)-methyltransferase homolog A-like [Elysia marginata]|uniref:tRNA (uracil(54)-C(5))-methyltransferase n=1 Tax=Elysia marginata TaxID=1093978 RepID=A0AAV4FXD2_9GAST|nr:tRNA (Uracil-5-)-methyltransferase homolog A-like [Elysia marginata]
MSLDAACIDPKDSEVEGTPPAEKKPKLESSDSGQQALSVGAEISNNADSSQEAQEENKKSITDPLSYTRGNEFTSEIFKIQIHNLPRFGFGDLKKRLKMLGLKPNKIKSPDRQSVCYVCFRSEEERDNALAKLNGHVWKNKTLEAKVAAPIADPYLKKQQQGKVSNIKSNTFSLRLKSNVCPLWNVAYSDQLQQKTGKVKAVLRRVARDDFLHSMFRNIKTQFEGMACELLPIVPSPETSQYRNKNEFTIGYGLDGKTVVVGFRYGLYKDGITAVGDSTNLGLAMPAAVPIIKSFTEFVSKSKWTPYLQHAGTGNWQTLTVRTFRTGDVMAMIDFVPRDLEPTYSNKGSNLILIFLVVLINFFRGSNNSPDVQLLFGEKHVFELLLSMKFRISPEAFFQVNTPATEKLYSLITDWCNVSPATTVLDVCCGTGTIGLTMAKRVKEVIGIEMCAQAVEDAKANAALNGVENTTYYCKKVEDIIQSILSSLESTNPQGDVVAVVDPPRAGLQKAVPVDLFPGTKHCELVLLFTRGSQRSTSNNGSTAGQESYKHKLSSESCEVEGSSGDKGEDQKSSADVAEAHESLLGVESQGCPTI